MARPRSAGPTSTSASAVNRRPQSAPAARADAAAKPSARRPPEQDNDITLVAPAARKRVSSRPPVDRGTELMRRRTKKSPNHLIWTVSRSVLARDPVGERVKQTVSMYEMGLRPRQQRNLGGGGRNQGGGGGGADSQSRPQPGVGLQRRPASADPRSGGNMTPGGHVNTPASARFGGRTMADTPMSGNRTPHSASGTPLIARGSSRGGSLLDASSGTPSDSARPRPQSAGPQLGSSSASLRLEPADGSSLNESGLTTPHGGMDMRDLTDFKPFMNCSASRFVDFVVRFPIVLSSVLSDFHCVLHRVVIGFLLRDCGSQLDPTVQPPRYAKPGERSAAYDLAEKRAPGPAARAARHRQRRENGERVRKRKVEREEAWVSAKIKDITRRERQKAELLYQRDNKRLLVKQRGMLQQVALSSRLQQLVASVQSIREEKEAYWEEHKASLAIGAWYRTRQMLKNMRGKNEKRSDACIKVQRWWRGILLYKHIEARIKAAAAIIAVSRAMKGSGKLQELIKVFRYKIVKIQRSWRESRLRHSAEVSLCLKKWEKTRKYLLAKEAELLSDIANVKEERSISQRERVAKRESLEQELEELPKIGAIGKKAVVPQQAMRMAAERWVRQNRNDYKTQMRTYFAELEDYTEQNAAMASKLAARQLMGARMSGDGMPTLPTKPHKRLLPSDLDVVAMIKLAKKRGGR